MNFNERLNPSVTTKALLSSVPFIVISREALIKMYHYVDKCTEEVGWMGTAYRDGKEIFIHDVYLFDQEVHATTTEITPQGLSDFAAELLQSEEGMEIWNNLKMWGHSHVNMGVTPSGQDDKQMETFKEGGHDWFIRLIANKKGELKIDLYNYESGVIYIDLPWEAQESDEELAIQHQIQLLQNELNNIQKGMMDAYSETIGAEMKVKVRKKSFYQTGLTHQGNNASISNWSNRTVQNEKKTTEKKEEKKEEIEEQQIEGIQFEDYFQNDGDVDETFSFEELVELGQCYNLYQLEVVLNEFGWFDCFTDNDLERIFKVGKQSLWKVGGYNER